MPGFDCGSIGVISLTMSGDQNQKLRWFPFSLPPGVVTSTLKKHGIDKTGVLSCV